MTQHRDGVSAVLRSGDGAEEVLDASYLIAADGSHSVIRKALGLTFTGRSLTHNYVLGDLHLAGEVPEDQLSIFLARNGFLAVFPMGDGRFRFMATDPDGITGDTGDPTLEDIQRLYDRTVHLPAQLYNLNWSSEHRLRDPQLHQHRRLRSVLESAAKSTREGVDMTDAPTPRDIVAPNGLPLRCAT